jgi:hypothetical protein
MGEETAMGEETEKVLKILGSEVPRSTAVLCTDSLVARPRGTKVRREVVLIRVLNSLGGNKDYRD